MTSASMLFAFVLKVRPSTPSPRSHASAPSFLSTGAPPLRRIGERRLARIGLARHVRALGRSKTAPSSRVEAVAPRRAHLRRSTRAARCRPSSCGRRGLGEAERVPRLERAELPVVAPLHRVIDRDDVVGDLAGCGAPRTRATARAPSTRTRRPCPASATSFCTRSRGSSIFAERLRRLLDRLVAALGAVLARLRIERLDRAVLAVSCRSRPCVLSPRSFFSTIARMYAGTSKTSRSSSSSSAA